MEKVIINFSEFNGPVYVGRDRGLEARIKSNLDEIDKDTTKKVDVIIPENAYTVTSSFFLGMFGPSIIHAKSTLDFFDKYNFVTTPYLRNSFSGMVENIIVQKKLKII